ncbi:MAG: UV DNA damage repair endonuclease UvsE [Firmicutes bacterium HGW-Firmicutes-14]|nr:MAG: UV DNA damage repair endonuclease UvsE [Firmicutes bacterium HGW-Firmicutes-14]
MLVRFGYVAMSLELENCSPSKTITVKNLERIEGAEARINRLRRITRENLTNTMRLLYYNAAHNIHLFRFTSRLVPLATHPIVSDWDYTGDFAEEWDKIGKIVRDNKMRISSHPDHFTLINSPKPEVLESSLRDLEYHDNLFQAMDLDAAEMVIHVGGLYRSRDSSIQRFKENFRNLPKTIKERLLLENDDRSFTAADVLGICNELGIPMVMDVHHHLCLNNGEKTGDLLPGVFGTWKGRLPKVHFSSPKSEKNCRAHADDIEVDSFYSFLLEAREHDTDFDVMVEAKNKDRALFNLLKGLKGLKDVDVVEEAAIRV